MNIGEIDFGKVECILTLMERVFAFLGKLFFPRQQDWEQSKNAKLVVLVVAFAFVVGVVVMKVIRSLYYSRH